MSDKAILFLGLSLFFAGMLTLIVMIIYRKNDLANILVGYVIGVGAGLVFYSTKKDIEQIPKYLNVV